MENEDNEKETELEIGSAKQKKDTWLSGNTKIVVAFMAVFFVVALIFILVGRVNQLSNQLKSSAFGDGSLSTITTDFYCPYPDDASEEDIKAAYNKMCDVLEPSPSPPPTTETPSPSSPTTTETPSPSPPPTTETPTPSPVPPCPYDPILEAVNYVCEWDGVIWPIVIEAITPGF